MMSATSIRSCTACLTRQASQLHHTSRSVTTLVKPPKRLPLTASKDPSRNRRGGFASAANGRRITTLKRTSKTYRYAGQRRKATWVGEASKTASAPAGRKQQDLIEIMSQVMGRPRNIPIPRWVTPKHYSITFSELFGHGSFILVAASYAVDDFLWLRIIAVAGSTSMLFFTYFHPHGRVLWLPFKWNCLFIAINSYRIGKVYLDRYLAEQLSDELRETRSRHFYLMDTVDFGRLARVGTIETFKKGENIIEQGQPNSYVRVVLSGGLKVMHDDKITYQLEEGNFISESGLHAGLMLPGSVESCCKIEAESDVRVLTWDRTELVELLNRSPHVRRSLKAVLSWDIVRKLKTQRTLLSAGIIDDPEAWTLRRHEQTEHRYASILKNLLATYDDTEMTRRQQELNKYRTIHHIDDEHHREALKNCGWTPEEFEAGHKNGQGPNQQSQNHHGPQWYLREMIIRVVG